MPSLHTAGHLINGKWEIGENTKNVIDPGCDQSVGQIAWGSTAETDRALDAAEEAFEQWGKSTARYRADILRDSADLLAARANDIALLLAQEAGKRLPEAQGEINFSVEYLRWFAEEARRSYGTVFQPEAAGRRHLAIRRPAGVVLSLTPWNFPVSIQARKVAPMLAAGCTVVARVSEKAPLAATEFFRTLVDAGVPSGVINLVHGPSRDLTAAMLRHPAVRAVSFTGSTRVGRSVMRQASETVIRPLLELGGNAAFIVRADADVDSAVEGAVLARLRNTGQSCVAANRFYVHGDVFEEFSSKLAARFDAMSIGHGVPAECGDVPDLGPMIDRERVAAVQDLVNDAVQKGGTLLTAPRTVPTTGAFLAPALVSNVPADASLATEEVFGPAAAVSRFTGDDEAVALANRTPMGLASYVWTADAAKAWEYGERLDSGIIGVNDPLPSVSFAPMGGTKQSGLGREGASVGLEEFEETHYLAWKP